MKRFQPGLKREARLQRHGGGRSRLRTGNKEGKEQQIVGVGEEADLDLQRLQQTPAAHLWLCVCGGGGCFERAPEKDRKQNAKQLCKQPDSAGKARQLGAKEGGGGSQKIVGKGALPWWGSG